ncbi:hypothetical protein [Saccharomonospora piscinae]|uniref:hypothetical protein n=1 Tax=Saccharomonospora piscinae TaxID=687388 RepID=UPI00315A050D
MMPDSWYNAISREAQDGLSATEAVSAVLPGGAAVGAAIGAAKIAGGAAGGGGGSWSFDPEEIDAVIADWKALQEQLNEDSSRFAALRTAFLHPSEDDPSSQYMQSLYESISGLDEFNYGMVEYVHSFIEKLENAAKSIGQQDDAGASAFGPGTIGES